MNRKSVFARGPHLAQDALIDLWIATGRQQPGTTENPRDPRVVHLSACAECVRRYVALDTLLDTTTAEIEAESDDLFSPARLARQRATVARRLEGLGEPAPLLRFPANRRPGAHDRPGRRWIAAAAAASVLAAVVGGRWLGSLAGDPSSPASMVTHVGAANPASSRLVQRAAIGRSSEEALLVEIDAALEGSSCAELEAIDALTPRVADLEASSGFRSQS